VTARDAFGRASAVLSAHASGVRPRQIARDLGITRARVYAILAAAGQAPGPDGRRTRRSDAITPTSARGRELLAQLARDAELAKVEPEEYLRDSRVLSDAIERIVELLHEAHDGGALTERERAVWDIVIGPVDEDAAQYFDSLTPSQRRRLGEKAG